jgi:hypothetical protein
MRLVLIVEDHAHAQAAQVLADRVLIECGPGLAVTWLGRHPGLPPELRLFAITGFLGGLTTSRCAIIPDYSHVQSL